MPTPFDEVIEDIRRRGFHNHRLEEHSGAVSEGLLGDLRAACEPFRRDYDGGRIRRWLDSPSPGGRARKLDLVVGEPLPDSDRPDLSKLRICVENKSVVTAHRNRFARFDDLDEVRGLIHRMRPEAILVATVLVGVAERVLNVPDRVKPFADDFEAVRRRLSTGDAKLWTDFPHAVSKNRATDPPKTVEKFRGLPVRAPGHTHDPAYDYVLLVPVFNRQRESPARRARQRPRHRRRPRIHDDARTPLQGVRGEVALVTEWRSARVVGSEAPATPRSIPGRGSTPRLRRGRRPRACASGTCAGAPPPLYLRPSFS